MLGVECGGGFHVRMVLEICGKAGHRFLGNKVREGRYVEVAMLRKDTVNIDAVISYIEVEK